MISETSFLSKFFISRILLAHCSAFSFNEITFTFSFTKIDSAGTPSEITHCIPVACASTKETGNPSKRDGNRKTSMA